LVTQSALVEKVKANKVHPQAPVRCDAIKESKAMTTGLFPLDPSNRKVILVLQQHDVEKCSYEPGAAQALLDEEAYVLPYPLKFAGEPSAALQNILDAGLVRPGVMLVQSPYDSNMYEEASLSPQRFALAKHMYFSTLCMHLGAKEVRVKQIDLRMRSGKMTIDAKGERLGAGGQISAESECMISSLVGYLTLLLPNVCFAGLA
jgi:hypothetical protein